MPMTGMSGKAARSGPMAALVAVLQAITAGLDAAVIQPGDDVLRQAADLLSRAHAVCIPKFLEYMYSGMMNKLYFESENR